MHHWHFFITHSKTDNSILLYNHVLFNENGPNQGCSTQLKIVNTFKPKTMTWNHSNHLKEYKNFHQCPIKIYLHPSQHQSNILLRLFKDRRPQGVHVEMLDILADKFNMTFQATLMSKEKNIFCDLVEHEICVFGYYKVSIEGDLYNISRTPPLHYDADTFVVSRGEQFTPLEKLLLPFDNETWILIILTFIIGYFTILIIYQFPRYVQQFVFGTFNQNPSLSLAQIFFGIGLIRTPGRNFARFIFMAFTLYCLVIRNAYQGKMFEFLHSNAEKSTPKTIKELIDTQTPIIIYKTTTKFHGYILRFQMKISPEETFVFQI